MIPHLVVTRLLIGIARPVAFTLHAEVLVNTLLPSMSSQTFSEFHWVIITDRHIDPDVNERLVGALRGHQNFHIHYMDPFETGVNHIELGPICEKYLGTAKNVITTRIDDDDSFSVDYLELVQRSIEAPSTNRGVLVACSSLSTLGIAPVQGLFGPIKSDSPSAGMSLFSPDANKKHVHSFNHRKIHSIVSERGGQSIKLDSTTPLLLSGIYLDSDSREVRGHGAAEARLSNRLRSIDDFRSDFAIQLSRFALPSDFVDQIAKIRATHVDHRPPIFMNAAPGTGRPLTRLDLKNKFFSMAKPYIQVVTENRGSEEELREAQLKVHLLKQAYYLV